MGQDCKYCGAYIAGDSIKCPACGKKIRPSDKEPETYSYSASAAAQQEADSREPQEDENRAYTYKDQYRERYGEAEKGREPTNKNPYSAKNPYNEYTQRTTPGTSRGSYTYEDDDIRNNKAISFLCCFGPLFLIPYLTRPNSDFVKFHSNQGLLLLIASILSKVLDIVPVFGWMMRIIASIFVFSCFIKGIVNVSNGVKIPLPIIGEINILK